MADEHALADLVERDHGAGAVPTSPPAAIAAVGVSPTRAGEPDEAVKGLTAVVLALEVAALGAALALILVLAISREAGTALCLLAAVAYAVLLQFVARPLAVEGRLTPAVLVSVGGLLAATLVLGFAVPNASAIAIVLPLLAVAVALPFVDRRTLLGVMVAAWIVEVTTAIVGELLGAQASVLPAAAVVRVAAVGVAAALLMLLLWQFSARRSTRWGAWRHQRRTPLGGGAGGRGERGAAPSGRRARRSAAARRRSWPGSATSSSRARRRRRRTPSSPRPPDRSSRATAASCTS